MLNPCSPWRSSSRNASATTSSASSDGAGPRRRGSAGGELMADHGTRRPTARPPPELAPKVTIHHLDTTPDRCTERPTRMRRAATAAPRSSCWHGTAAEQAASQRRSSQLVRSRCGPTWCDHDRGTRHRPLPSSRSAGLGWGSRILAVQWQMTDAIEATSALVGGGVLDRHPGARIMFLECGAGWLLGLAERMDEVYDAHAPYVSPKLSRRPSDIVRDQVMCSFQNDPGFVYTLKGLPDRAFLYATDYPHSEGTLPVLARRGRRVHGDARCDRRAEAQHPRPQRRPAVQVVAGDRR